MAHRLRTVDLNFLEKAPQRFVFDESADSLIDALLEEWVVESNGDGSTVRWTFAVEPGADMEAALPAANTMIGDMFDQAMVNLGDRLSAVQG